MTQAPQAPTRHIATVAVFCGSNVGDGTIFQEAAAALGAALARRGIGIVYGGTHKGLMGILADAALAGGGRVHGVITERLHGRGHLHATLSEHEIVGDMRVRKERMLALADACIALPGGLGTVEEFMEAWTLNQLGDIDKPVGLLNAGGYYDPFMAFVDGMIAHRFLPSAHRDGIVVAADPDALIDGLAAFQRVTVPKWM
jgi:uncharacterized protein (TIGR00730 family)